MDSSLLSGAVTAPSASMARNRSATASAVVDIDIGGIIIEPLSIEFLEIVDKIVSIASDTCISGWFDMFVDTVSSNGSSLFDSTNGP